MSTQPERRAGSYTVSGTLFFDGKTTQFTATGTERTISGDVMAATGPHAMILEAMIRAGEEMAAHIRDLACIQRLCPGLTGPQAEVVQGIRDSPEGPRPFIRADFITVRGEGYVLATFGTPDAPDTPSRGFIITPGGGVEEKLRAGVDGLTMYQLREGED